jgi:hypothetical protein
MAFDSLYVTCFLPVFSINAILLFLQHSKEGRKRDKKSKKATKTKRVIKEHFFSTQVSQDVQTDVSSAASKTKKVKQNVIPLPTTGSKTQNNERNIKNTGEEKKQYQYDDDERKVCNLDTPDKNLVSKRKRRMPVLSGGGSVQHKKKRKRYSQNDILLPGSNISNMPIGSECEELTKGNWKNQNLKKCEKGMNSKTENPETLGSTRQSPYSVHRLKQMIEASDAKELSKERITERKQVKETGSLRERMLKRLQASRFR